MSCRCLAYRRENSIDSRGQVDFDGDEMSAILPVDNELAHLLEPLKPHKSAHSVTKYRTMSANFSWPKPIVAAFSAGLAKDAGDHTAASMAEFAA